MAKIKASPPDALYPQDIIEIDELWHYTKKRRKLWVWVAVFRLTRRVLTIKTGSRGATALKRP